MRSNLRSPQLGVGGILLSQPTGRTWSPQSPRSVIQGSTAQIRICEFMVTMCMPDGDLGSLIWVDFVVQPLHHVVHVTHLLATSPRCFAAPHHAPTTPSFSLSTPPQPPGDPHRSPCLFVTKNGHPMHLYLNTRTCVLCIREWMERTCLTLQATLSRNA